MAESYPGRRGAMRPRAVWCQRGAGNGRSLARHRPRQAPILRRPWVVRPSGTAVRGQSPFSSLPTRAPRSGCTFRQ
jgi:hypothetical protein